jgi:hypothetical protein
MNTVNIPGFTAESSLGPTKGIYRGKNGFGGSVMGQLSMQQLRGSFFGERVGTRLTCCSADFHFCTTRNVFPFERCKCGHDFDGFPIFICQPPVLSRG